MAESIDPRNISVERKNRTQSASGTGGEAWVDTAYGDDIDAAIEATHIHVGTPLRDAAVDPEAGDFGVPTNAGLPGEAGNPHGPNVVSPVVDQDPSSPKPTVHE